MTYLQRQLAPHESPETILAFVKDEQPTFAFMVERRAEGSLDEIILGFIILEQFLRLHYKSWDIGGGTPLAKGSLKRITNVYNREGPGGIYLSIDPPNVLS